MLSASKYTFVALTEELMPCPFDSLFVGLDDFQQFTAMTPGATEGA
jgi:hypothetical protein